MNPLKQKVATLPHDPGCYLFKDSVGRVCYVGKAKDLRHRVGQYLAGPGRHDQKTLALVAAIQDLDVILTRTEVEALLLERTLIKHHQPRFNILLRDDKEYPYLRVNFQEPWPRIEKVRRRKEDGAVYLGPFGSAGQLRVLVDAAQRIFPLVRCSRHEFAAAKRPCNYYHLRLCPGPCTLPVDRENYVQTMQDALDFLRGRTPEVLASIRTKMQRAAAAERFEVAAVYRDQLEAFASVTQAQAVVAGDVPDADAFGFASNTVRASFRALTVRDGKLVASDSFIVPASLSEPADAMRAFLLQYYEGRSLPREILVPLELPDQDELRQALMATHPDRDHLDLKHPARGPRRELVEMAGKNATWGLDEVQRSSQRDRVELNVVKDKLCLSRVPQRVECIDISNIQGSAMVASDVCFLDGRPAKEFYRHYSVNSVVGGPDDFGAIREVVGRRLARARQDGDLPDLLVIDGGRGQLSAALEAAKEFSDLNFDLVSLAKSRLLKNRQRRRRQPLPSESLGEGRERSYERVFVPNQEAPIALAPGTPEYRLLTRIRDEAHRFAITHHRKVRGKTMTGSDLQGIPGVGPTLHKRLLVHFGGLEGLRTASLEQLTAVPGIRETVAVAIHSYLQGLSEITVIEATPQPRNRSQS